MYIYTRPIYIYRIGRSSFPVVFWSFDPRTALVLLPTFLLELDPMGSSHSYVSDPNAFATEFKRDKDSEC
jgi:hypothetical protein